MHDTESFAKLLDVESPWFVSDVNINDVHYVVTVTVETVADVLPCPHCARLCKRYDTRSRQWRHLNTMEFTTIIRADLPRVTCPEHGVVQPPVPWAEPLSRYTMKFECEVIDWLREASVSAVAKNLSLSWNAINGIMIRAVERGLLRRSKRSPKNLSVDETSFQRRHEYVTVVTDQDRGDVLFVADNRTKESLGEYFKSLGTTACKRIRSVSMDMWEGYIGATKEYVANAEHKICFDKFHVAQYLGNAVDKVRRQENKELLSSNDETLKGSKYLWLQNPINMDAETERVFQQLRTSSLKTAQAWAIKEHAMCIWNYLYRGAAEKQWAKWYQWASSAALQPMQKVAETINNHLWGIINAIILKRTNAAAESMNSRIQRLKSRARGFRNRERFRSVIFFHYGNLDLYP